MQENNSIIIAMLEELLTISKNQRTEQIVNANVDLTPIKELIESSNRENKEYYDAKTNKLAGFVANELGKINKRMDGINEQEQPDFEGVKQQLEEAIDKMDEIKVKHNINEKRFSFALYTKGILDTLLNVYRCSCRKYFFDLPLIKTKCSEG